MYSKKILLVIFFLFFSNIAFADPKMELGLDIFKNKAQCGMCHALQAAKSEGQIGPNLNELKPLMPQIINAVTNGIGVMPAWESILTSEEIDAVAYFVFKSTSE